MRIRRAFLVFRKDWREIRRNWQVILPIIIVPVALSVVLPSFIILVPGGGESPEGAAALLESLPSELRAELSGLPSRAIVTYLFLVYLLAPFFLIIPLLASTVIAADSFAGEKERRTIEALLAMPISDSELFLGKVLVSFVPSMIVTWSSFAIYTTITDVLSFSMFNGRLILPNLVWILFIFGLAPLVALSSIGLTVTISARVKGFREAQQISTILLVPILGLFFGQLSGAVFLGPVVIGLLAGGFAIVAAIVFEIGVRLFRREEILARLA